MDERKKPDRISKANKKRGPKPETVKVDEDWEQAIKKSLKKKKPKEGWPK